MKVVDQKRVLFENDSVDELSVSIFSLSDTDIYEAIKCESALHQEFLPHFSIPLQVTVIDEDIDPQISRLGNQQQDNDPNGPAVTPVSDETNATENELRKPLPHATKNHDSRKWTDASGTHEFQGTFIRVVDQRTVVLRSEKGSEIQVPLSKISYRDIFYAVINDLADKNTGYAIQQ